jgi:hypothetical protein
MPTLLLSPRHGEDSRLLWRVATRLGWQVHRVYNWQVPELSSTEDVAIYGEPLLCRHLCQQLHLTAEEPALDWLAKLPHGLRKREVRLTTLAEARKTKTRCFIKPADEKGLDAKIYQSGAELPARDVFPQDLAVLVQEVVTWHAEFRCFVLNSKVRTAAPYWLKNKIAQDEEGNWLSDVPMLDEAIQFADNALAERNLKHPHAFVLDVGMTSDRGWAVIEANAAFSSGIYGCDHVQALEVIRQSVRKNEN